MILYINCCVRKESRTNRLAKYLLSKLGGEYDELKLSETNFQPLSDKILEKRTELAVNGDYSDPMFGLAKQFKEADTVVIAAPYWDLSFPAVLKTYIENIMVSGLTFRYTESGIPKGLCRAKKLYYVTTSGGPLDPTFGFGYIKAAAEGMLGLKEAVLVKAEMLDIIGADVNSILESAEKEIDETVL